MKRNYTVDFMKALAICMVLACHVAQKINGLPVWLEQIFKFGQLGVQVFFVMTAYLCCCTNSDSNINKEYFLKKYLRLAPAYYFGIVFYVVLFLAVTTVRLPIRIDTNTNIGDIGINFALLNNLVPSACNNVVPGGWSIGCIWIFFVLFPFLIKIFKYGGYTNKMGVYIYGMLRVCVYTLYC